jgi:hypothetical protein
MSLAGKQLIDAGKSGVIEHGILASPSSAASSAPSSHPSPNDQCAPGFSSIRALTDHPRAALDIERTPDCTEG